MVDVDLGNVDARVDSVLEVPASAAVLVRGGEVPAIVAFEDKGRRVVVFQLDIDGSNLPLQVSFPVLVANVMNWLGETAGTPAGVSAGEPMRWNTMQDGRVVVTPDGRTIPLKRSGTQSVFTDTAIPGVYHVEGRGEPAAFVVNPSTDSESDLSAVPRVAVAATPTVTAAIQTRTDLFTTLVVAGLLLGLVDWRRCCRKDPA